MIFWQKKGILWNTVLTQCVIRIGRSSNGRTSGFGPEYLGSSPSLPVAALNRLKAGFAFCDREKKVLNALSARTRKPFESKIELAKILAKRYTDPVRREIPSLPAKMSAANFAVGSKY